MSAGEETGVFEIKGPFIIEMNGKWVSINHKLTKRQSQIMIFETYIKALEYCLERKFNKPKGYKITTQNQMMLPID